MDCCDRGQGLISGHGGTPNCYFRNMGETCKVDIDTIELLWAAVVISKRLAHRMVFMHVVHWSGLCV